MNAQSHKQALAFGLVIALTLPLVAARPPQAADVEDWTFHSLVPLGFTPLTLKPANTGLTLMATAESPMFEGWRRLIRNNHRTLVDASGTPVPLFPQTVNFRITATSRNDRIMPYDHPDAIPAGDANDWLKNLRFRLKIYNGLESQEIEPAAMRHLGMPPDVPYDERIYLVSFELEKIPSSDRLVLEVFAPDGTRVGKFHLELL